MEFWIQTIWFLKGTGFFLRGKGKYLLKRGPLRNFCGLVKWMMDNEAYFVISSLWRIGSGPRDWNEIFRHFGKKKSLVVSVTGYGMFRRRGEEILHWIHRHKESFSGERYAVIDDECFDIRGIVPEECFFSYRQRHRNNRKECWRHYWLFEQDMIKLKYNNKCFFSISPCDSTAA